MQFCTHKRTQKCLLSTVRTEDEVADVRIPRQHIRKRRIRFTNHAPECAFRWRDFMLPSQTMVSRNHIPSVVVDFSPATTGEFVQFQGVFKSYGENLVVMDHMNLDMRADDRLVIIGPSGSGKSSLLRVMMGLEGIQSGSIKFQGRPYIHGADSGRSKRIDGKLQRQIGMVFQHYTLFPHLSVLSNLI